MRNAWDLNVDISGDWVELPSMVHLGMAILNTSTCLACRIPILWHLWWWLGDGLWHFYIMSYPHEGAIYMYIIYIYIYIYHVYLYIHIIIFVPLLTLDEFPAPGSRLRPGRGTPPAWQSPALCACLRDCTQLGRVDDVAAMGCHSRMVLLSSTSTLVGSEDGGIPKWLLNR